MKFHESILCFIKCPRNYISLNTQKENLYSVSFPEDVLKLRYYSVSFPEDVLKLRYYSVSFPDDVLIITVYLSLKMF